VGSSVPDEQWKSLITEVDENGDGEISTEEFVSMMRKLLE
jgi:Ca2+-binding EF-hand superfamily protein